MSFGNNLKYYRNLRGMSQPELGEKLSKKVSAKTISSWEVDRTEPTLDVVNELSQILGVSLGELINNTGSTNNFQDDKPKLTPRDERDIAKTIKKTLEQLEYEQEALMFDGAPIDDETKELLKISLENTARMAKKIAKEKYTPKKYRKE